MCGIAGIFTSTPEQFDTESLVAISKSIAHRGPNDEGFLLVDTERKVSRHFHSDTNAASIQVHQLSELESTKTFSLALIHRRLSIIDLSPLGHQPMSYDHGKFWIVFNGEIYNYKELRTELEALGHSFQSHCDTEVLLAAYKAWGVDALQHLNGMWAFSIYDVTQNILFCARDRTGVKPFYFVNTDEYFAFASEIKTLVETKGISQKELNHKAIWDYLVWGIIENEENSFWKDVFELKPSHYLIKNLRDGNLQQHKYYNPMYGKSKGAFATDSKQTYVTKIRQKLDTAVQRRLNSDVPVGVSLSGGMDSSAICAIAQIAYQQQYGKNISAYTVSFPGYVDDETSHAEKVAQNSKVNWNKVRPEDKISREVLEKMVYYQDLPFLSISLYSHFKLIEKVAADGITVFLEGQGGDELFSGYPHHNIAVLREKIRGMQFKDFWHTLSLHQNCGFSKAYLLKTLAKNILLDNFGSKTERLLINKHAEFKCLNAKFKQEHTQRPTYATYNTQDLHQSLQYDTYGYYLKFLLRATDRTSMAHGVECRTTFADDVELIDYVNSIPSVYKHHEGYPKYLLRKATEDILPESISWRKDKKGFASPERTWLLSILEDFEPYLEQDLSDFFDKKQLLELFEGYKRNPENYYDMRVWRIINFIVWKKVFVK